MSSHQQVQEIGQGTNQNIAQSGREELSLHTTEWHDVVQDPLVTINSHLVDISHLARKSYDELVKHQSRYEQAYLSEHQKLLQEVAARQALALENERLAQENRYCKQELLPGYDRLLSHQAQQIKETQKQYDDLEAQYLALKQNSGAEIEEHKNTANAVTELLKAQYQEIEGLENRVKELSTSKAPDHSYSVNVGKRQRSSKLRDETSVHASEPATRGRRCKQIKSSAKRI